MTKQSGNPAKQPRPDGREPGNEVTAEFPPTMAGVITEFGASVIPFPFRGGKAIRLELKLGSLDMKLVLEPQFSDTVCKAIEEAAAEARSGLDIAGPEALRALANGSKR